MFAPPAELSARTEVKSMAEYEALYARAAADPEGFWAEEARRLDWMQPFTQILDESKAPFVRWFADGGLNLPPTASTATCAARSDKPALVWEGEPGDRRTLTYAELHAEVCRLANALAALGVKAGDRVAIYMPMVPELAVALLACARIGATHSVIFGGFSAEAIRDRVNDAGAKVIITADGGWRRGKVVPLKANVDTRARRTAHRRAGRRSSRAPEQAVPMGRGATSAWDELVAGALGRARARAELDAEHPLFILYTSGTTGKPKGVVHIDRRLRVGVSYTTRLVFDLRDERRLFLHRRRRLGHRPQLRRLRPARERRDRGACTKARPTIPEPDRFWEIIERHKRDDLLHGADRDPRLHALGRRVPRSARSVVAAPPRHASVSRSTPRRGCGTGA